MSARSDAACFVGVDLHKETLTACAIAAKGGEITYRKIACVAREKVREFLAGLPRPSVVAIETVGFYRWPWTEAEPIVDQVASERRVVDLMKASEFRRLRAILESIPGVGLITAATAIPEIGDFSRFSDSKAIGRYAGLTPIGYSSSDKHRLGRICKTGSPDLRWALQQAAWTAIRCDGSIKKTWLKIAKTAGKKAAAVAIARKLLVLMWTLVRKDEPYKSRDPVAA